MLIEKINVGWANIWQRTRTFLAQDRNLAIWGLLGLMINIAIYVALAIIIGRPDQAVILHYDVYFGINLIDTWPRLYILPVVGTFIFLINGFLAFFFYINYRFISILLISVTTVLQILLFLSGLAIIIMNQIL